MTKTNFKNKVLAWIKSEGIDITGKPVRVYKYQGMWDVRIYNQPMEMENTKSSFRRTEPNYNDKGEIIGWHGTRGVHSRMVATYTAITEDDFNNPKERSFILEMLKS